MPHSSNHVDTYTPELHAQQALSGPQPGDTVEPAYPYANMEYVQDGWDFLARLRAVEAELCH